MKNNKYFMLLLTIFLLNSCLSSKYPLPKKYKRSYYSEITKKNREDKKGFYSAIFNDTLPIIYNFKAISKFIDTLYFKQVKVKVKSIDSRKFTLESYLNDTLNSSITFKGKIRKGCFLIQKVDEKLALNGKKVFHFQDKKIVLVFTGNRGLEFIFKIKPMEYIFIFPKI